MSGTTTKQPDPIPSPADPPQDRTTVVSKVVVSIVAELIFVAALAIAWWTKDPSLSLLLGVAATNATAVVSYWIGSSAGSSMKDTALAKAAVKPG